MISASIVTYKNKIEEIDELVFTLINSSITSKLYIVDNSPTNKLQGKLPQKKTEYIFVGKNIGYGAAHNIAIKKSVRENIKYHLVINPDIIINDGVIDELIEYMEEHEEVGLVMPKILYLDGETQYLCKLLASPFDLIARRFIPFKKAKVKRNIKYELRFTGYDKIIKVPSLSGCFMLLRTDVLKKVGEFDERFFMYCEDFDFCRRIGEVSKTVFYPKVSVTHNYEKGSYKNLKLLKCHIISAIKYFNKWGWFFDKDRRAINRETLLRLGYKK